LCKSYTTFLKANRAPSSYNNAKETLTGFLQFVGNDRKADSLQRHELRNFIDSKTTWGTHRQGSGIAHVVAAYNYGIEKGSIKTNPFNKFKKPANQSRVVLLSQEQEQAIKAAIGNKPFGDYWQFLLLSGARPDEGARVEAKHLQETAQGLQIVLQEHKAARKTGKVRVIYLNPEAAATFAATCYGLRFKEPLPLRHKPQRFRRQLDLDGNGKGAAIAAPFLLRYGETKTPLLPCGNKGVHGILGFSKSI
jgi:integrase